MLVLGLAQCHEEMLCSQGDVSHWLDMDVEDQALYLYRHPDNKTFNEVYSETLDTEKNVRESEKTLERAVHGGWIEFDAFFQGVTGPIGTAEPVTLRQKGYSWAYVLPSYLEEDKHFIKDVIFNDYLNPA